MWKLNEILVRVTGKSSFVGQSGRVKSSQGRMHQLGSIEGEVDRVQKGSVTQVGSGILGPSGDGLRLRKEGFPVFCQLLLGM